MKVDLSHNSDHLLRRAKRFDTIAQPFLNEETVLAGLARIEEQAVNYCTIARKFSGIFSCGLASQLLINQPL